MKERLFIFLSLAVIIAALIGLNAASYAPVGQEPDTEQRANRSTYHGGATGTRAFYEFLRENGKSVSRWQERIGGLLEKNRAGLPKTLVIIGGLRRPFEKNEFKDLLTWIAAGNKLVLIDRSPDAELLPKSGNWQIEIPENKSIFPNGDSSNVNEMTNDVSAARPLLPNLLTAQVNSVMPSKFAAPINLRYEAESIDGADDSEYFDDLAMFAPVAHLSAKDKNFLVDFNYGAGKIILLSDPYIVSNGGIGLVDNLRLATNLVSGEGLIAFDEYHQGVGASGNSLLRFFEGTPLPAIAAQAALLLILLVYTRGRRFARAVPLPNPDRRSKLEYIGAMAELQRRTRSYDLAIENIYGRTRRNLARFAGVDNAATTADALAARVAERSKINRADLTDLLRDCEDVIHGEPVRDKQAIALAVRLREVEKELGINQPRDAKNSLK